MMGIVEWVSELSTSKFPFILETIWEKPKLLSYPGWRGKERFLECEEFELWGAPHWSAVLSHVWLFAIPWTAAHQWSFLLLLFLVIYNYFYWFMCGVLVVALGIFSLCCGMWTLSCWMWDLVPQTRDWTRAPALGAWSLNHRTTREVPRAVVLDKGL